MSRLTYERARQTLTGSMVYFADCQVATLEMYLMVRRTPKSKITRQADIAEKMVRAAEEFCAPDLPENVKEIRARFENARKELDVLGLHSK